MSVLWDERLAASVPKEELRIERGSKELDCRIRFGNKTEKLQEEEKENN